MGFSQSFSSFPPLNTILSLLHTVTCGRFQGNELADMLQRRYDSWTNRRGVLDGLVHGYENGSYGLSEISALLRN
jgi:hypothetical protein